MEISFTKNSGKSHIISCRRNDGTVTWMQNSSFFITHDLCHYALETKLGLKKAFYGMLAAGTDINDFELPKDQRTFQLTEEAILAEQMVNLLTIEYSQGRIENFVSMLNEICHRDTNLSKLPDIKTETLDEIRNLYNGLMNQWVLLPEEETMILKFEE
ncbi:MAG: hypothetical protein ABJA85_03240 [Bacteroidota bacterium]